MKLCHTEKSQLLDWLLAPSGCSLQLKLALFSVRNKHPSNYAPNDESSHLAPIATCYWHEFAREAHKFDTAAFTNLITCPRSLPSPQFIKL